MTKTERFTRLRVPAISVVATVSVLAAVLLLQHLRHGWPFSLHMTQPAASAARPANPSAPGGEHTGHERVAVDVDASKIEQVGIRLERVRGETLRLPLRAVATVVPSRTRTRAWLDGWSNSL